MATFRFYFPADNDQQMIRRLRELKTPLSDALTAKLTEVMGSLQERIREKVSGEVLQEQTGRLAESIELTPATKQGRLIRSEVDAGSKVVYYGKIQEMGTSDAYSEDPRKRRGAYFDKKQYGKQFKVTAISRDVLAFQIGGQTLFRAAVNHPPIQARPFFYNTLEEMRQEMVADLQKTFAGVVKREGR